MKLIPHPHSCPSCLVAWECANTHCEDPESHWCRNFKDTCPQPPPAVLQARAILDAAEDLHHAAWLVADQGQDTALAEEIRGLRARLQEAAGLRANQMS